MIKLGNFTFDLDDYPSQLPTGGTSKVSKKQFPGGQQTIQDFGAFEDDIVLQGTFLYSNALQKANTIDTMWKAGKSVQLVVSGLKPRWVNIVSYKPVYKNDYDIDYTITLTPVSYSDPNAILYNHSTTILSTSSSSSSSSTTTTTSTTSSTSTTSATPQKIYIVKTGDSLWKIAQQFYGDGSQYPKIVKANNIKNPSLIYPGTKMVIP